METVAGVKLTEKQIKNVKSMQRLLKNWDNALHINCIAGTFYIMLGGDTEQNPFSEYSDTQGFNPQNVVYMHIGNLKADGGDW